MNITTYDSEFYRSYRYGFNGMEKDDEVKGNGNSYTTEFRQYDPRLGRWLSIDPMAASQPYNTPYNSMGNNPISRIDPNGDTDTQVVDENGNIIYDDNQNDGNIYRAEGKTSEDFAGMNTNEVINSEGVTQLTQGVTDNSNNYTGSIWLGTEDELKDFIWKQGQQIGLNSNISKDQITITHLDESQSFLASDAGKWDKKYDYSIAAFGGIYSTTVPASWDLRLNLGTGDLNSTSTILLFNVYDIRNVLVHENSHFTMLENMYNDHGTNNFPVKQYGFPTSGGFKSQKELMAMIEQQNHASWGMTTILHQNNVKNYWEKQYNAYFKEYKLIGGRSKVSKTLNLKPEEYLNQSVYK